jgi:hypothetical protein
MQKYILILILSCTSYLSFSQTGWDFLYGNDLFSARNIFNEELKKDSLNESSLLGSMLIAEITEDQVEFKKSARRLMFAKKDDGNFHTLFSEYASFKNKEIIDNKNLNITAKLPYLMENAENEKYFRRFENSQKIYNENITHLNWSYIGPFSNINGYGFEVKFPIETDPFTHDKKYSYKNRDEYSWVTPKNYNSYGTISFSSHLESDYNGAVYYANSFFELKEQKNIQLRISRTEPIKIWIDDQLVFENWRNVNFEWDGDIVNLNLEKGFHRILIKYCPGYYYSGKDGGTYGGGGDYDEFAYDTYDANSYYNSGENLGLAIRLTDSEGKLITIESKAEPTSYSKVISINEITSRQTMTFFKNQYEKNDKDISALYLYYAAARHSGLTDEIEEMLFNKLKAYPSNNVIRFLAASVYTENGKNEIAERTLSAVNMETFPIYSVLYKNLKQTDSENEAEQYLAYCQYLLEVSPSNLKIIKRILNYYEEKGLNEDKKTLAKDMIKKYPEYKYTLEDFTKDNNKPDDYDIGNDYDYSSAKEEKSAAKNIKKYYSIYDYETLITKYKGENKSDKVISLYDEVIKIEPDNNDMRQQKAEYLFNVDKNQEAITVLNEVIINRPYEGTIYELLGDIYFDMKDNENALKYFKLAKLYGSGGGNYAWFYGGAGGGVDEKIDKISGQKQLKNKFITKSFEEMIADDSWKVKYANEESVILGYTTDIHYENDGNLNLYTRMLIKILTEAGANSWTEYNFNFMGDLSMVKVIKKNGAEIVPDRSGSFIVFKNLEPGDMIKLEGSAQASDENELGNMFGAFNVLSLHAPMHYVKVEMAIAENSTLNYLGQKIDYKNVVKSNQEGKDFYKWEFNSIDKIVQEEAIIDIYDLYPILQVNSFKDWTPIVEWYMAKTYRKLEPNYEAQNIIDSLIKPGMNDQQKIETIYNYITNDINYSFTQLLQSNYIPKNSDLTICSKIGDCKDVSTVLITLLKMVNINAYYVLVKTNNYFHMKTLPNLYFDHVITAYELDGKMHFTDPTSDFYPYYVTNENDVDAWGLLIKEGETEIFQLPHDEINPEKNLVSYNIDATLNTDRSLQMKIDGKFTGLAGGWLREMYQKTAKDNFETELLKFMGKGVFENLDMDKFVLDNPDELTPPLTGNFEMSAYSYSDNIDEIQFMRIPYVNAVRPSPIISSKKRYNSLALSEIIDPEPTLQKVKINLPVGYSLRKLPKDISIENDFVIYKVSFKQDKNGLYVEKYQQFKKTIIPVEEFEKFKQAYLQLLEYDRLKITFNVKK